MTALLLLGAEQDLAAQRPVLAGRADLLYASPRPGAPVPLLFQGPPPAGVTRPVFDAVGPSSAGASQTGTATPFTWSHTCTGSNRILLVGVCVSPTASDAGISLAVTYAGTSMTPLLQRHSFDQTSGYAQLFYLIAPATGANTVSVAITGNTGLEGLEGGSISFTGADQSAPIGATTTAAGNSASATATISSSSAAVVVDLTAAGSVISNSSQTNAWTDNRSSNSGAGNGGMGYANGAASITFTRTLTADWWAELVTEVLGVAIGAAPIPPVVFTPASGRWPGPVAALPLVQATRADTPLQASASPAVPQVGAAYFRPVVAPQALVIATRAAATADTPPLLTVAAALPAPAFAVQAVQALMRADPLPVTPLPTPDIPATAGIWPQTAPRPVLLAMPGSPVTAPDAVPRIAVVPAGLGPQTAALAAVLVVRADTPLQASSQPPILAVIPAGYARPPQGGQTVIRSASEPTDPVVGLKLNVTATGVVLPMPVPVPLVVQVRDVTPLQVSASPPVPVVALAGRWPASVPRALATYSTADQAPPVSPPTILVAPAGIQAPSAARPVAIQAPASPLPADGLRRILAVPVLQALTAAARVLLGRSPFDPVTPPVVRLARADAGTRRGPGADPGTRAGPRTDAGTRRTASGDSGIRPGPTGTAGRKRGTGAKGGP